MIEPSMYEEDSYFFLQQYQYIKQWVIYDSKEMDYSFVKALVDQFTSFHGKIPFAKEVTQHFTKDQLVSRYWSAVPLGIFRYKMSSDNKFYLLDSYKENEGYIVEGCYWHNGFVYLVKDKNEIVQLKLFIDQETKQVYGYPDTL